MINYRPISISGVTTVEQAIHIAEHAEKDISRIEHYGYLSGVLLGIQVSNGSLTGAINPQWAAQFPDPSAIKAITDEIERYPNVKTVLHWCARVGDETLEERVSALLERFPHAEGIQLNVPHPDPAVVARLRRRFPERLFILQIGSKVLEGLENSLDQLLTWLFPYVQVDRGSLCDAILLDPSDGNGIELDPEIAASQVEVICALVKDLQGEDCITPILSGGLSGSNLVRLIGPSHQVCSWIGTCAQRNLRTGELLDLQKVEAYYKKGFSFFCP